MAVAKFAVFVGVKYPTFASWVKKRRRQRKGGEVAGRPAALQWVEAAVELPGTGLRVELQGGATQRAAG